MYQLACTLRANWDDIDGDLDYKCERDFDGELDGDCNCGGELDGDFDSKLDGDFDGELDCDLFYCCCSLNTVNFIITSLKFWILDIIGMFKHGT